VIPLPALSYVENIARQRAALPDGRSYTEWLAQLNQVYGMDQGILRVFHWLGNALRGEFGESWATPACHAEICKRHLVQRGDQHLTFVLEIFLCIPWASWRPGSGTADGLFRDGLFVMGMSLPTFFRQPS
jgi:peptide/nickel transport system permease protein